MCGPTPPGPHPPQTSQEACSFVSKIKDMIEMTNQHPSQLLSQIVILEIECRVT